MTIRQGNPNTNQTPGTVRTPESIETPVKSNDSSSARPMREVPADGDHTPGELPPRA